MPSHLISGLDRAKHKLIQVAPGLLLCLVIGAVASVAGVFLPVLGAPLIAVILGVVLSPAITRRPRLRPGTAFTGKFVLQLAVVLLGGQMSLTSLLDVGARTLPILLSTLTACFIAAWILTRALRVERTLGVLIAVGTGICGASAIAAVSPVVKARPSDTSYAISTIFLFNVVAVALFPAFARVVNMNPHDFAVFAGTAVNDTSSVVAATTIYASSVLGIAVVVKLVRTLAIIPVSIGLSVLQFRRGADNTRLTAPGVIRLVPWFLVGFVLMVCLVSIFPLSNNGLGAVTAISGFLIASALGGIGLATDVDAIRRAGWRPLLLGGLLWIIVAATALAVLAATAA